MCGGVGRVGGDGGVGVTLPLLTACVLLSLTPAATGLLCSFEDGAPCVWQWNSTLHRVTGREAETMVTSRPAGLMTATTRDADNRRDGKCPSDASAREHTAHSHSNASWRVTSLECGEHRPSHRAQPPLEHHPLTE